jgi:multiple sugar transport system permease protein
VTQRRHRATRRRAAVGALYAAPTAALVTLFFVVPLLLVVWVSLHDWPLNPALPAPWNAPDNYTRMPEDSLLRGAAWFTVKYTVIIVVLLFGLALGLALLVQRRRRGVGVVRTAFFLPVTVGFASASLLFLGLISNQIGPVNDFLQAVGILDRQVSFTTDSPELALGSAVVLVLWRFGGFMMLILLTGLQAIPVEVYEAARIDGATRWQAFSRITMPLLRPTIALVLTLMVAGSMLAFDQFWLLTRGGPDNSTTSLVMLVYREAFIRFDLGAAAAISVVLAVVLLVFSTVQLRVLRRRTD